MHILSLRKVGMSRLMQGVQLSNGSRASTHSVTVTVGSKIAEGFPESYAAAATRSRTETPLKSSKFR